MSKGQAAKEITACFIVFCPRDDSSFVCFFSSFPGEIRSPHYTSTTLVPRQHNTYNALIFRAHVFRAGHEKCISRPFSSIRLSCAHGRHLDQLECSQGEFRMRKSRKRWYADSKVIRPSMRALARCPGLLWITQPHEQGRVNHGAHSYVAARCQFLQ